MSVTVLADALGGLESYFQRAPEIATTSARIAINSTLDRSGMKRLRTAITDEIRFPVGYVDNTKLFVSERARDDKLEAKVTGRQRPTSLARFVQGSPMLSKAGVKVAVKQDGQVKDMDRAFLVSLNNGASLGLAIRLKDGEILQNKRERPTAQLANNLYLLYGPSVDQVFRTVADEQAPAILEDVQTEFLRQFDRLSNEA